jgi:hypothetical protein
LDSIFSAGGHVCACFIIATKIYALFIPQRLSYLTAFCHIYLNVAVSARNRKEKSLFDFSLLSYGAEGLDFMGYNFYII